MEEGMTIAKVPDWVTLKPEMMAHLIREHEKLGRTLTEAETVTLLRSLGFEISEATMSNRGVVNHPFALKRQDTRWNRCAPTLRP